MNVAKGFLEVSVKDLTSAGFGVMRSSFMNFAGQVAGIFAGISAYDFLKSSIEAGIEAEKVSARLAAALRLAGDSSEETRQKMERFAASLMSISSVGDEDVKQVMSELTAKSGILGEELKTATIAAIGLAKVYEIDLTSASKALTAVINGKTAALAKYGIVVDETKSKQELLNDFIAKGVQAFKESTSETDTYAGKLKALKEQWGELQETASTGFLRSAGKEGIDTLTGYTVGLSKAVGDAIAVLSGEDKSALSYLPEAFAATVLDALGLDAVLNDNAPTMSTTDVGKAELEKQRQEALNAVNNAAEIKSRAAEDSVTEKPVDMEKERLAEFRNYVASFGDLTEQQNEYDRQRLAAEYKIQALKLSGKEKEAEELERQEEAAKRIFDLDKRQNDEIRDKRQALIEAFQPFVGLQEGMTEWLNSEVDKVTTDVEAKFVPLRQLAEKLNSMRKADEITARKLVDPFAVTSRTTNYSSFYNGVGRAIGEVVAAPKNTQENRKRDELLEKIELNTRRRPLIR